MKNKQRPLFDNSPEPLAQDQQSRELAELVARYRVTLNQLTARMMYLERRFRRSSDGAAELVGHFVDTFIESCTSVPEKPEEWEGGKCYTSDEAWNCVRQMYHFARDLRRVAKRIITIRRHFYRDLSILRDRHHQGESAFDSCVNLRIDQRRQWSPAERKTIWASSEKRCRYCGTFLSSFAGDVMHVDHIVPKVAGGGDEIDNLAASCATCNLKKNAKSEERFLAELLAGAGIPLLDGICGDADQVTEDDR